MPVFFSLLEGIVYFIIGTKVKSPVRSSFTALSAPLWADTCRTSSSLFSPCHCRAAAVEDGLRQREGADRQLCHQSGAAAFGSTIIPYAIAAKAMADQMVTDGRQDAILAASQMLQSWVSVALVAGVIVAAFIGAAIGKGIVKKHLTA